jgi:LemA protein
MELWVILGLIVTAGLLLMMIYNRLVALRQTREQAFSDIDVQLKQRLDLVPQLVETVKGYAGHEKQVMENLTAARAGVQNAGQNTGERIAAENVLTRAIGGFFAVAENYPDLKASQNFQQLMSELSDIENKIAAARRFFNNATSELNTAIEQFPAVLFAAQFGFKKEEFFEVTDTDRATLEKAPDVKFGT